MCCATTEPEASDNAALAGFFARLATGGDERDWALGAHRLGEFDGRGWLLIDDAARYLTCSPLAPVSGVKGWLSADAGEPLGFVAAVTSWHYDGRFRERATRILGQSRSDLSFHARDVIAFSAGITRPTPTPRIVDHPES